MTHGFDTFIGVDFSAAADGGRRTWIAVTEPREGRLAVVDLFPARDLPGSGRHPDAFLPALADFLAGRRRALAGLDFPFSLPRSLIDADSWTDFVQDFAARYPDPAAFRAECRRRSGGRELRRRCDVEARTPFSPYNLRLFRQTWFGIARLLAPLVARGRVGVAPMLAGPEDGVLLAEICPASTLRRLNAGRGYKGRTEVARARRSEILKLFVKNGLEPTEKARTTATENHGGDALDAIIAAHAVWRSALATPEALRTPRDDSGRLEARVFF